MKSKFAIKRNDKTYIISPEEILFCKTAPDGGTKICLQCEKSIFTSYGLYRFVEGLPTSSFLKPHRSYLVNLKHIKILKKDEITLSNGKTIPVVNGYFTKILDAFSQI